jgi:hypothetical protein
MKAKYSGQGRRDCPVFRTRSEKLEMAVGSRMPGSDPTSARLLVGIFLEGVANLVLG